jgi:hypothetical protein
MCTSVGRLYVGSQVLREELSQVGPRSNFFSSASRRQRHRSAYMACLLLALGLKLVAVEDHGALARVKSRLTARKHPPPPL